MSLDDKNFMREALVEAKKAFAIGEVPVGAVAVYENKILSRAHNLVEQKKDASAHAELLCLQKAATILGNWRLKDVQLFCTLEPCAMCAGACALFRVQKLVYAAPDLRHGANGSVFDVLSRPHPIHRVKVVSGVFETEAKDLMQEFFRKRRLQNAKTF